DAARHARVSGSLHTVSEQCVQWWIQRADGSGFTYTLKSLAKFFGVRARQPSTEIQELFSQADSQKNKNKRRGWEALNSRRLRDFERLRAMRGGGFEQGCRNRAAMLYAWLLRCNSWSRERAAQEVAIMASACRPRLTPAQCRSAVKTGFGRTVR